MAVPLGPYCTWCSCFCLWESTWRPISYVRHKARKTDRTWGKRSQSFRAKHKELSCCFPLLFWPLVDPTNQQGSVVTSNLASISSLLPTDLSFRTTEGGNNKWYSLCQMSKASSSHCCSPPKKRKLHRLVLTGFCWGSPNAAVKLALCLFRKQCGDTKLFLEIKCASIS